MKNLLLSFALFLPTLSFAQSLDRKMEALIRTDDNRPVLGQVLLTGLTSAESFDGEHFKIVKGKSDEAIRFDADYALKLRAATTYYHLMKARDYFVNKVKSQHASMLQKMTIRVEHTNQFSELGHFAHDNLGPQHNNALTIPGGNGLEDRGVKPWGLEIWFRPAKRVHLRDLQVSNLEQREFNILLKNFRNQIHMQSLQRFLSQAILAVTAESTGTDPFSTDALVRMAGASVLMEAGYQFIDPISKVFNRKWYWLDTAMVPEIIYHEYAHAALSDNLVLSHSTAIVEGMADFFAGQIANSPKLATHIKQHNTFNGKKATRKQEYVIQFETQDYANADFVFGMLWELKNIVGQDKGDAFMYELRTRVNTNSTIRDGLIEGILNTCEDMCATPFVDKLRILKALNLKGL